MKMKKKKTNGKKKNELRVNIKWKSKRGRRTCRPNGHLEMSYKWLQYTGGLTIVTNNAFYSL